MDDASFIQSLVEGYGTSSNHTTVYGYCSNEAEGETNLILQCITEVMEQKQLEGDRNVNRWLMLFSGGLIFFMQTGFAMLCAGCVRKKNVQNTMLKNLLDACGAALGFFLLGYAFAFGGQDDRDDVTFIGTSNFLNTGKVDMSFWLFQFAFSATAVTIVAGTLAERCQMVAYLCYSIFLTGFVYPVAAHTIWSRNGFLSSTAVDPFQGVGAIDFAGSGVVHVTGGTTAVVATYILGARKGRFYDNRGRQLETPKSFPGHSVALQLLGTFVLWFGWYGFNPGSALLLAHTSDTGFVASRAAVNTSLSAASGAVSALMTNMFMEERSTGEYSFNIIMAMNGALAGLVSITAACGTVQNWAALCIGCIGGLIYLWGSKTLVRLKLDDAVDAIPVHMFAGGWGLLAVGLLSDPDLMHIAYGTGNHPGLLYSWGLGEFNAILLSNQVLELVFVAGWAFGTMTPFFLFINRMGWFRSDSLEELVGLDEAYHGGKHGGEEVVEVSALEGFIKNKIRQSQIRSPYN